MPIRRNCFRGRKMGRQRLKMSSQVDPIGPSRSRMWDEKSRRDKKEAGMRTPYARATKRMKSILSSQGKK